MLSSSQGINLGEKLQGKNRAKLENAWENEWKWARRKGKLTGRHVEEEEVAEDGNDMSSNGETSSSDGIWPPVMARVVAADNANNSFDTEEFGAPIFVGKGKYQVLCQIGKGSFGNVFLARSVKTGKEVALKVELATCARPKVPREV